MKRVLGLSILMLCGCVSGDNNPQTFDQTALAQLGNTLELRYRIVSNIDDSSCKKHIPDGECFTASLTITSTQGDVPANTALFFSHISPVRGYESEFPLAVTHVNGDLHKVTFNDVLPEGRTLAVQLSAPFWHAARSDAMPNYYLTYDNLTPVTVRSTTRVKEPGTNLLVNQHAFDWDTSQQTRRYSDDNLPLMDARYLFEANQQVQPDMPKAKRVIPKLASRKDSGKQVSITGLSFDEYAASMLAPAREKMMLFSLQEAVDGFVVRVDIKPEQFVSSEGYAFSINRKGIAITAASRVAANYGLLSLMQLWDAKAKTLPETAVQDAPRFGFRGLHVDVARHFHGKTEIEALLKQMFMYKLNKLHLHLSDDEGWRLEIDGLPELTEVGSKRCHDVEEIRCLLPQLGSGPDSSLPGNGYFTAADYVELVRLAHSYGIEIIPSFDMPGHARAAIKAMEVRYKHAMAENDADKATRYLLTDFNDTTVYSSVQFYNDNAVNPCLDSTYTFIEKVMTSVKALHAEAGVPLVHFHIGADEIAGAWKASPVCQQKGLETDSLLPLFISRVQALADKYELSLGGWSDGIEKATTSLNHDTVYTNVWDTLFWQASSKVAHLQALNIPVVLSFPDVLYFDFPYVNHPLEPGYYWGSKATDTFKVFSFMPQHLSLHSQVWKDRMGNTYQDDAADEAHPLLGIQAQLWSEVTIDQAGLEYMLFPRLLAFAERAWHEASWQHNASTGIKDGSLVQQRDADWQIFNHTLLSTHLPLLAKQNINVRVPPPGAKRENGKLFMNSQSSILINEFSKDGETWQPYKHPISIEGRVWVRSRIAGTDRTSRFDSVKASAQ